MKIGIIGSGNMRRTLGMLWLSKGYDVFFGTRNETSIKYIQSLSNDNIQYGSLKEAVEFGEILFYSLRDVMPSGIAMPETFEGKILIDPNNGEIPNDFNYAPRTISYSELYKNDIPSATIVKAFNTVAQEVYYLPTEELESHQISSPFCMDDEKAKSHITKLIRDTGLIPLDCGGINQSAKLLESFADLTRLLMIQQQLGAMLAFSSFTLPEPKETIFGKRQTTNYK